MPEKDVLIDYGDIEKNSGAPPKKHIKIVQVGTSLILSFEPNKNG